MRDPGDPRSLPPGEPGLVPSPPPASPAPWEARPVLATPLEDEGAHFWDYWRVVVRHRWTVITFFLVSVIVGTLYTYTRRPVYTATALLRIEKEELRIVKFEEVLKADPQQDYYQTQYNLLRSRSLANRVIGLLQLEEHPEFQAAARDESWVGRAQAWARGLLVRWVPVPPPPAPEPSEDLALPSPVTGAFLARLSVAPERGTRLVSVSFGSHYPDLAARVTNALAETFIASNLDHKLEASRYATRFLGGQVEEARRKHEEAEDRLNRFLARNEILVTPEKGGERVDLMTKELMDLSEALLKVRAERIAKESLVVQALNQDIEALPAVLENPHIGRLKQELLTLEAEYRKLGQTFKPEYPRMQRLAQSLDEVRRQLRREVARSVESLDGDYQAARRKEELLQREVDAHRAMVKRLGAQVTEYTLLRREVDTNREHYAGLLTRLKEIGVSSALQTSPISIVDRAEVPAEPSEPRRGRNLLFAVVVGLAGGIGLAFLFEYLDTSIKDVREVETVLGVPLLGLVPARAALEGRRARRLGEGEEPPPFALVAHRDMGSTIGESFRNLRTSLLYSSPEHPPRTVMVTSPQSEDGKTSLAANLAITLAQLGTGEVLLVDADMRRPNLHELLGVPKAPGLSTFLTGQAELPAALHATDVPGLYVVPAGRTPTNPAELIASARMVRALDVLRERFVHIVFDTPPVFGVSDALALAPRVEGVVLVLRQGQAHRDAARRALQLLGSVRARLLGVVLNDVNVRRAGAGYYGYYGYHGYGDGDGRDTRDARA